MTRRDGSRGAVRTLRKLNTMSNVLQNCRRWVTSRNEGSTPAPPPRHPVLERYKQELPAYRRRACEERERVNDLGGLIRREGQDPSPAAVTHFMAHYDIVPVAGQRWTLAPFGGEIVEGRVWERGTALATHARGPYRTLDRWSARSASCAAMALRTADRERAALSRTTEAATVLRASEPANVLPTADCRSFDLNGDQG